MRILITSIVDLKRTPYNRLHQFVKHLSRDHKVVVVGISDWWKASQADAHLYTKGLDDDLHGVDIRYLTRREVSPILQECISVTLLGPLLQDIQYRTFDVHLNYNSFITGYLMSRRMKAAGINTVYDVADDIAAMVRTSPQIHVALQPLAGLVARTMVKQNMRLASKVTFITYGLKERLGIPDEKGVLVPNAADTRLFRSLAGHELRSRLGLDNGFVLGYVGVLREWVDLKPVFAAVRKLIERYPDLRLLIVGEEGRLAANKELAKKYGLDQKAIFAGTVPWAKVPEYIACMDICLLPFHPGPVSDGALPLKLFEYMACQKPVISTRLPGVAEIMGDRVLYASDEEEYAQAIISLRNDRHLREEMGKAGRAFVGENFEWSKSAEELGAVLQEASRR